MGHDPEKILVIDEDFEKRKALAGALKNSHYEVMEAEGRHYFETQKNDKVVAIFTDSSSDVLNELSHPSYKKSPIVIFTDRDFESRDKTIDICGYKVEDNAYMPKLYSLMESLSDAF